MKHALIILLALTNAALAQVIETNLETGVILLPVRDTATHEMLRASLGEKDPLLRIQGLVALQTICDPADLALIHKMTNDPVAAVREQALNQPPPPPAKIIHEPTDLAQIIQGLSSKNTLQRQLAVDVIAKLKVTTLASDLVPLLDSSDSILRRHVCEALGALRNEQTDALARQLARDDDPFVRRAAAEALLAIHSIPARDALIELLKHPNALVRLEAACTLGDWRQPTLAGALHPLLQDVAVPVVRAAADSIGKLGNPDSRQPTLDALAKSPLAAKARVIWALGELHETNAVPALIELLKTYPVENQANAADAIGKLGDTQAILPLRKVLVEMKLHDSETRQRAIESLRRLNDRESVKRVMQIITEQVVPPPPGGSGPSYDADETRAEGVRYLAFIGNPALGDQMVAKLTETPSYALRKVMAETLSQLHGKPYRAEFSTDVRHYFIESLAGDSPQRSPKLPGIVVVP